MTIILRQDIAELWVESDFENDRLQSTIQELIEEGLKPVIYRSGKEELLSLTQQLLFFTTHQPTRTVHPPKNGHPPER